MDKKIKLIGILFSIITLLSFISSLPIKEIIYALPSRGYLKVVEMNKVEVYEVMVGSPAQMAGLKEGDFIKLINGIKVTSVDNFVEITKKHLGESVTLIVTRDNVDLTFNVLLRNNFSENEGAVGVLLTNETYNKEDKSKHALLLDAIVKPYLGYESVPRLKSNLKGPVGFFLLADMDTLGYFSYEYAANFEYLKNLLFTTVLFITTLGILKRRKSASYLALVIGIYTVFICVQSIYIFVKNFVSLNLTVGSYALVTISLILNGLFSYSCFYVFNKRKQFS